MRCKAKWQHKPGWKGKRCHYDAVVDDLCTIHLATHHMEVYSKALVKEHKAAVACQGRR